MISSSDPEDLTSAAGDDVNAGIMLSGVGGRPLTTEDEENDLRPVEEEGPHGTDRVTP